MVVLDERRSHVVRSLCELIVPGCGRVAPEVYIDALLARMPEGDRAGTLAAIDALASAAQGGAGSLAGGAWCLAGVRLRGRAGRRGVLRRLGGARRRGAGRGGGDRLPPAAGGAA